MTANRFELGSPHGQVVEAAAALLRGELGVIEGARRLSSLAHLVVDDWTADPDFRAFGALDTETDHLPVGAQRQLWDSEALAERDAVVQRIEREARAEIVAACRSVIARFAAGND